MNERLRQARKALKLNQEDFGNVIGLSNTAISKIEVGENAITEQNIKAICREFKISYDWLKYGTGDMFDAVPETLVDEIALEFDLDDLDKRIILGYLQLNKDERACIKKYIQSVLVAQ